LLHGRRQALVQAGLAALDPRIDEAGTDITVQWRLVAVLDHQRHAMAAGGVDQCRAMCLGVADLQRMLQRHPVQLLRQLCHQRLQCIGVGRVARIELPQQWAEPVTERQCRLQERCGRFHGAGQVASLHQVARRLHREAETVGCLRSPLRALGRSWRAVERAVDLDAAQGAAGVGQFLPLRQACWIEHTAAPFGKHPAADAAADLCLPAGRGHWPWSVRHGS